MNTLGSKNKRSVLGWTIFVVVMAGVFCLGLLAASITERRAEVAGITANKVV